MAAGEYVSVQSQADTEEADLALEHTELLSDPSGEHKELAALYVGRGLDPALAKQVATQLMAHDAIGAHARDELGISENLSARPIQAALASCRKLCCRSRLASCDRDHRPRGQSDSRSFRNLTGISRGVRRISRSRGRCVGDDGRHTRHILGCTGHGTDRRSRNTLRYSGVNESKRTQTGRPSLTFPKVADRG